MGKSHLCGAPSLAKDTGGNPRKPRKLLPPSQQLPTHSPSFVGVLPLILTPRGGGWFHADETEIWWTVIMLTGLSLGTGWGGGEDLEKSRTQDTPFLVKDANA